MELTALIIINEHLNHAFMIIDEDSKNNSTMFYISITLFKLYLYTCSYTIHLHEMWKIYCQVRCIQLLNDVLSFKFN